MARMVGHRRRDGRRVPLIRRLLLDLARHFAPATPKPTPASSSGGSCDGSARQREPPGSMIRTGAEITLDEVKGITI